MPTSPVLLVHGKLHWQHHASLQRHADVQQQHGDHAWLDGADVHSTESTFTAAILQRLRVF